MAKYVINQSDFCIEKHDFSGPIFRRREKIEKNRKKRKKNQVFLRLPLDLF